jgi:hypothetical protein
MIEPLTLLPARDIVGVLAHQHDTSSTCFGRFRLYYRSTGIFAQIPK